MQKRRLFHQSDPRGDQLALMDSYKPVKLHIQKNTCGVGDNISEHKQSESLVTGQKLQHEAWTKTSNLDHGSHNVMNII